MATIETEQFWYVHMPKTAGSWVSYLLESCGYSLAPRSADNARSHWVAADVSHSGKPIVGTVRDPWSWYISYINYTVDMDVKNDRLFTQNSWLYPYFRAAGGEPANLLQAMLNPIEHGVQATGNRPPPVETLAGDGMSLYTYNMLNSYWPKMDARAQTLMSVAINSETVRDGLPAVLRKFGYEITPKARSEFLAFPKGLVSKKRPSVAAAVEKFQDDIWATDVWAIEQFDFKMGKNEHQMWDLR